MNDTHLPTRRDAVRSGAVALAGFPLLAPASQPTSRPKSVIFVFLTGGLSQLDSFDLKPDAPETVRGEFLSIPTRTSGLRICEHLPLLAQRSDKYTVIRSMATGSDGHEIACHMLLSGRLDTPAGFTMENIPNRTEWPSILAQVTHAKRSRGRNDLPVAAVLPEPSINEAGKVRPGQYSGRLGPRWEAWHLGMATKCPLGNGACPFCFRFDGSAFRHEPHTVFETPNLSVAKGSEARLQGRMELLKSLDQQPRSSQRLADAPGLDQPRLQALGLLGNPKARAAFLVEQTDEKVVSRYGRNKFGLSLLMASRLSEAGVGLVQVNLGKNSTWDTHNRNFINLKQNLFPYFDHGISALLDDLSESGRLDDTLVIVTGEFGRTPKINKDAGRDHWGAVMSLIVAGGGVRGGRIIGSSDRLGAQPATERCTPENLAATIYTALGIPAHSTWEDMDGRPYELYRADPIEGLM